MSFNHYNYFLFVLIFVLLLKNFDCKISRQNHVDDEILKKSHIEKIKENHQLKKNFHRNLQSIQATVTDQNEIVALEQLYSDWSGVNWIHNTNWLQGDPCVDQWYGLKCEDIGSLGIYHITEIDLAENNIVGQISNSLSSLVHLERIDLSFNSLEGTIPSQVFQPMTNLYDLTLNYNNIKDTLEWTNYLPLNIQILWIAYNQFHGLVPTFWSKYTGLYLIFLEENQLSGEIPPELFNPPMQNISLLDLGFNQLTGFIPDSIGNSTSLQFLWLYDNFLEGEVPSTFSNLGNLVLFEVTTNNFTGELDQSFIGLNNLSTLRLTGNKFSGGLNWVCNLPGLSELLGDNNLFTSLPNCTSPQYELHHLVLSNNKLKDVLPDGIGNFYGIRFIKLSYNEISGKIPDSFSNFHNLSRFDISENRFNCSLMEVINPLKFHKQLSILTLAGNFISGGFQEAMVWDEDSQTELLTSLFSIDVSRNNLTGPVPEYLSWIPNLNELDISYNNFYGPIPDLNYLSVLYAESNNLTGNNYDLPNFMVPGTQRINLPGEIFSCPSIIGKYINMRINIDSSYYNHSYCTCNVGYRGYNGTCQTCPDLAYCPGGGNQIKIPAGYFPYPSVEDPMNLIQCVISNFGETSCNPDNSYNYTCQEGYTDRLCSKCEEGYFSRGLECSKCPTGPQSIAIFIVVVLVFILLFLFFIFTDPKRSLPSSTRKTVIYYYQVFNLLLSKLSPWPSFFSFYYSGSSWINFSFGFLCIGKLSFWPNLFIVMICLPVIFIILSSTFTFILYLGRYIKYKRTEPFLYDKKWLSAGVRVNLVALNFLYLPLCIYVFQNFSCRFDEHSGNKYMSFFPYIQCNSNLEYDKMFIVSILAIIVYVIGIPLLFGGLLYNYRKRLDDPQVLHAIGSIYIDYRKSVYWFEMVSILRRFFMAVSLALIDPKSSFSIFVVLLVIGSSIITQIKFKPFVYVISNYAESSGNSVLLFSYACVLILSTLRAHSLNDSSSIEVILSVVVVVYTVLLGLLFIFSLKYFLPVKVQSRIDDYIIKLLLGFRHWKDSVNESFHSTSPDDDGYELTKEPIFQKTNSVHEIEFRRRVSKLSISQQNLPTIRQNQDISSSSRPLTQSSPNLSTPTTSMNGSNTRSISVLDLSLNNDINNNNNNNNNNDLKEL